MKTRIRSKSVCAVLAMALCLLGANSVAASNLAITLDYPVEASLYQPGSYSGRIFFKDSDHLGEDINLPEGTPIKAIGNGVIKLYRGQYPNSKGKIYGYGELYAIIEHDLGSEMEFTNAYGQSVKTQKIYSIYGHIRKSQKRGGEELLWEVGEEVKIGDIIGYVNDTIKTDKYPRGHNGDGGLHFHLGIRLRVSKGETNLGRGYEGNTDFGKDFVAASVVIAKLKQIFPNSTPQPLRSYTFPSHASSGWTIGNDTQVQNSTESEEKDTWRVRVIGPNPGIKSPVYASGELPQNIVVYFSMKQKADGCATFYYGKIWVKDETGSWNNSVQLELANADYEYNGGAFAPQNYNAWKADF